MIDHATQERHEWIRQQPFPKAKRAPVMPDNWVLLKAVPVRDESIDAEYKARADSAWAKTRAIGGGHG